MSNPEQEQQPAVQQETSAAPAADELTPADVLEYLVSRAAYDPHDTGEQLRAEHLAVISDMRSPEQKAARQGAEKQARIAEARKAADAAAAALQELEDS